MEMRCKETPVPSEDPCRGLADVDTFEIVQPPTEEYIQRVREWNESYDERTNKYWCTIDNKSKNFDPIQKKHARYLLDEYDKKQKNKRKPQINKINETHTPRVKNYYDDILCKIHIVKENFNNINDIVKDIYKNDTLTMHNKHTMISTRIEQARTKSRKIISHSMNLK